VSFGPRAGAGRAIRSIVGVAAAFVLSVLLALPVGAAPGPTRLSDPEVSATSGTPSTTFTFAVVYRNREGSEPDYVRVAVAGGVHDMAASGTNWKSGVRFTWSSSLPVGEHAVEFRAMDRDKFAVELAGPTVVVAVPPTPTPTPTPKPTPTPTPHPTPPPTPEPTATPRPTPTEPPVSTPTPRPTPEPTDGSGPAPTPSDSGNPSVEPTPSDAAGTEIPGRTATPSGGEAGAPGASGSAVPSEDPQTAGGPGTGPDGGSGAPGAGGPVDPTDPTDGAPAGPDDRGPARDGTDATELGGWGELARMLAILDLDQSNGPVLHLLPAIVWSAGGVTMLMAFSFIGKRRRDGEQPEPDEVLEAKAARAGTETADGSLVTATVAAPKLEGDLALPRWRRPSLLEARKADPIRNAAPVVRLSFDHGVVAPEGDTERRLIRYHVVELLGEPDELRSARIGSLTQGDEVALLEKRGSYWRVLCPDGREGWIHKMTLGDVVGGPTAPSPQEAWGTPSGAADEIDDDVLRAFMEARARA
jgi:hypothetical protein